MEPAATRAPGPDQHAHRKDPAVLGFNQPEITPEHTPVNHRGEWKSKLVGANPATTLEQQYVCHARFGYAFWLAGFHWDLEAARPKKSNWTDDPYSHKCNW